MELNKKFWLRAILMALLLFSFYQAGVGWEALAILGLLFAALLLLREKIWKGTQRAMEKYLPFTKNWPNWAEKAAIIIAFIAFYFVLKTVLYFILGLFGIDIEQIILAAFEKAGIIPANA
ncbi:MAG: hypothetical protein NUV67_03820 [archaeon]|nr:hypothetical protein [archaeon]